MNRLVGNSYLSQETGTTLPSNGSNPMKAKNLPYQSESLFGMALYDFDTIAGDAGFNTLSPPVFQPNSASRLQAPPPVFHPVDEYKDLSLKEILDLSDDFLSNDDHHHHGISGASNDLHNVLDPVPFGNSSQMMAQQSLSAPTPLAESTLSAPTALHSFNPKKRTRDVGEFMDSQNARERRFRPYQAGQWAEKFEELCEYKKTQGHCLVPHTYNENLALARWVKRQRYQYKLMLDGKSSTMTPERVTALEDIGFVWDSQGNAWGDRLQELEVFRKTYMHCNVPSNFSENPRLATWIKCQRRQYKLYMEGKPSNMTPQRIQHLESL